MRKRVMPFFFVLLLVFSLLQIPTVFAEENDISQLQYEICQDMRKDRTQSSITLTLKKQENVLLEKVKLPDGKEVTENLETITYRVSKNGTYNFKVCYCVNGESKEETIQAEVTEIGEKEESKTETSQDEKADKGNKGFSLNTDDNSDDLKQNMYNQVIQFDTTDGNQGIIDKTFNDPNEELGNCGLYATGTFLSKKYFIGWSTSKSYLTDDSAQLYYSTQKVSDVTYESTSGPIKLYAIYVGVINMSSATGTITINPDMSAADTIDGNIKENSGFDINGSDKSAIVYFDESKDNYQLNLSTNFEFNQKALGHLTYLNPGGVLTNSGIMDDGTKKGASYSHVDLHINIDSRVKVADELKNWSFTSYSFEPLYILDEDYNLIADVSNSVETGNPTSTFSFASKGKNNFILRVKLRTHDRIQTTSQIVLEPMYLTQGDSSNFTISKQTAQELARTGDNLLMTGYIDGVAKASSIKFSIPKIEGEDLKIGFSNNEIPVILAEDKTLTVGDTFDPLKDVTASDKEDGNLTDKIEVLNSNVNTSKAGVYEVTYKVTDSQGACCTKTIAVIVNPKMETLNEVPLISATDKTLTVGDTFDPLKDVTASDKEDGNLTDKVEVLHSNVDTSKAGVYEVTYKVTDGQGASCTKTIMVTVKEKKINNPATDDNKKPNTNGTDTNKKPTNTVKRTSTDNPKTGDNVDMVLWIGLVVISGCMTSVLTVFRRRKRG